jgi:hypothetical protein
LAKRTKIARPQALAKPEPAKGRPSEFSQEIADEICAHIASGKSLRSYCMQSGTVDAATVYRWLEKHESFRDMYARARVILYEHWADEIGDIADLENETDVNRARLRVDARKWLLSKMLPRKYGERLQAEVGGTLSIVIGKDDAGVL